MKLVYKISLVILCFFVCISVVFAFLVYTFTESSLERTIAKQQLELARQTMDKIDRFLYERWNNIVAISEDEEFEGLLAGKDFQDQIEIAESDKKLRELALYTGPWDSLDLVNKEGKVVFSTIKPEIGQSITEVHFSKEVFEKVLSGKIYYSDVYYDDQLKRPVMSFAAPIRNEDDPTQPVTGAVVGHLAWQAVLEILQNTQGVDVELLNKNGIEIGDNHPENIDEIFKENAKGNQVVQKAIRGESGSEITSNVDEEEEDSLTSFVKETGFLTYEGNGWVLLIENPVSVALADARINATNAALVVIPIMLLGAAIIIFLLQRLFIRPVVSLTKITEEIAQGNMSKRAPITSKDEIGTMAKSFNIMAENLQALYAGLEKKVAEKTEELAKRMEDLRLDKEKIDEQNKILDSILENLPVGVALSKSPTGQIMIINKAGVAMLGKGIDPKALKENISEIYNVFKPDGTPYPSQNLPVSIALSEGHGATKDDIVIQKPDGVKISVRATSVPLKDQQGQVQSVITVFEDVTRDKEIDRMKTEFISLASHQLRTPLSAIKWFSEMLLGGDAGELNPEQKDFAQNITDSTERMIQLVNSLLNISRIESGRILIDPRPTDLKELVQSVVTDLKAKIEQRKQNLLISVHEDLPKITIDPRLIRQVYMNLLTNAIKYTPKGGEITVFISKKGDEIISQVTDNGYGIPKAQQDKIFQKFFRAENVVKVETDGTGLGLYLIKAIIESSKGKIWFESEEGKGATFWFSLPLSGMEAKKGEVTLD